MSLDDFFRCTPSEFYCIWKAWQEREELRGRDAWERTRMEVVTILQPHARHRLDAHDVLKFPWDEKEAVVEQVSDEDRRKRFEEAKKRYGLK